MFFHFYGLIWGCNIPIFGGYFCPCNHEEQGGKEHNIPFAPCSEHLAGACTGVSRHLSNPLQAHVQVSADIYPTCRKGLSNVLQTPAQRVADSSLTCCRHLPDRRSTRYQPVHDTSGIVCKGFYSGPKTEDGRRKTGQFAFCKENAESRMLIGSDKL